MVPSTPRHPWTPGLKTAALVAVVVAWGMMGAVEPTGQGPPALSRAVLEDTLPTSPTLSRDIRVIALLESYGPLIDSVSYTGDDAIFMLKGRDIHFRGGRMLSRSHLDRGEGFEPLFYEYSLQPLRNPPPLTDTPTYSTDFLEALFGRTEDQIRGQGVPTHFLDRKVFLNAFCLDALMEVERDIRAAGEEDPEVSRWVSDLEVAYSFIDKEIVGSGSRSLHAWGLAIDLVPTSYLGKHVYWRWSRVFHRNSWHRIPIQERWSPPQRVIEAFERHGFVWGGKWSHFDTIHFEYRPEILAFNRMRALGLGTP